MQNKIWIIIIAIVAVAAIVFFWWQSAPVQPSNQTGGIRNQSRLTEAEQVAVISPADDAAGNKLRIYNVAMSKDGFSTNRIVVNKGDIVQFNVTAVDGHYDFNIKNYGFYMDIPAGTRFGSIEAVHPGMFDFSCQAFCPDGVNLIGQLVVLE